MININCYAIRVAATVTAAFVLTTSSARAQTTLKCRGVDDRTVSIIAQLKQWINTTDPETKSLRDNIVHLPVVAVTSIKVVTDEKVCAKVIQGYTTFPKQAYTPTRLYVIKLGSKGYVGYDPDRKGGEFTAVHIFNTKFVRIGGWVG